MLANLVAAPGLDAPVGRQDSPLPDPLIPESTSGYPRAIAQHRNGYRVHDGTTEFPAQPAPRLPAAYCRSGSAPHAVGDFVLVDRANPPLIHEVLERRTALSRAAAGERYQRQIIATNIDYVFVLMGLDGDFNLRRIERYLALIQGSGAQPVIVLSKIDKVETAAADAALAALRDLVPPQVEVRGVNAKDPASVAPLLTWLQRGDTAVLVGSSGAGKSTLTNTLIGSERHATAEVREHDSRGRHTTTHRSLLMLPSGGCMIDTPGMRELKLTGDENLVASSFADIETLALECRFGDCGHSNEPGCAVRAALESGTLADVAFLGKVFINCVTSSPASASTLEAQLERKANARVANKALGKRLIDKYGRR